MVCDNSASRGTCGSEEICDGGEIAVLSTSMESADPNAPLVLSEDVAEVFRGSPGMSSSLGVEDCRIGSSILDKTLELPTGTI